MWACVCTKATKVYIKYFICLYTHFAKMRGWVTEQAPLQGPEKENNTNTYNNDNVLETTETAITNKIGANVGQRINKTFDRASLSMAY